MKGFNESILKIIDLFEYDLFIIQQNFDIKCTCINYNTKQADPNCPKCLGTGYKIKIKKIRGAKQDSTIPNSQRPLNELLISALYYIKNQYPVYPDNIIVDGEEITYIYQRKDLTSFGGEPVYQKCIAMPKKLDSKKFMKNFNNIIGRNN